MSADQLRFHQTPVRKETHTTLGCRMGAKAFRNQRCELIFLAFFSLRQKRTCTGTRPRSAVRNFRSGSMEI